MPRVDRKQREFEQREQEILDAALVLFSAPSWETVSIEQIAKAADIGKGTLYKHFASKDELLFRLMMRFYQGLLKAMREFQLQQDQHSIERFGGVFEHGLRYHQTNREYRYIVEYCNCIDFKERAEPKWHQSLLQLDQAFSDWSGPLFNNAMDQKLIERRPLAEIQIGVHASFDGAVKMLWAGKDWCSLGDDEVIIKSVSAFMRSAVVGRM